MDILPVGAEYFLADRPTDGHTKDMTKLIVAYLNFSNAPRNHSVNAL